MVFFAQQGCELAAIRPTGKGDVTKTHVAWRTKKGELPSISSLLSDGKYLYLVGPAGHLSCWQIEDGKMIWEEDPELTFLTSPTLSGKRVYLFADDGTVLILRAGAKYEVIGKAHMGEDEVISACPAFLNGQIYVRGKSNLYCIGSAKPAGG